MIFARHFLGEFEFSGISIFGKLTTTLPGGSHQRVRKSTELSGCGGRRRSASCRCTVGRRCTYSRKCTQTELAGTTTCSTGTAGRSDRGIINVLIASSEIRSVQLYLRIPPNVRIPPLFSRYLTSSSLGQVVDVRIPPLFSRIWQQGGNS